MMGGDMLLAETLRELPRGALGHPAGIDEHQRRAVRPDQLGYPVIDLLPHLRRHDRLQRRGRDFEREIAGADVTGVDDRAPARAIGAGPGQESRHGIDWLLRRR